MRAAQVLRKSIALRSDVQEEKAVKRETTTNPQLSELNRDEVRQPGVLGGKEGKALSKEQRKIRKEKLFFNSLNKNSDPGSWGKKILSCRPALTAS